MLKEIEILLENHDEVYHHSANVRDLATDFAYYLGYSNQEINRIRIGSFIHDVGKLFIPSNILYKKGKLTNKEYSIVKKHSFHGFAFLKMYGIQDEDWLAMVVQHHERVDGRGYPFGLKKEEIHPYAKLLSVCDVYDTIVSVRSYKESYSHEYAIQAIEEGLGTQFDEKLGNAFLSFMNESANKINLNQNEAL